MLALRVIRAAVAGLALSLFFCIPVSADIYRYVDKDGVWHFTNVQTDVQYKLYIKTPRKTASAFIKEYGGIISQASRRFGVDVSLVKAVIKAESDFDHRAVSQKGAQGLMQLMPETSDAMAVGNPFDPEENIFGGTRYLSILLKRFKNDTRLALAAYNSGPERVETHNGVPPIPETERFVKKVMHYYHNYNTMTK
ncbi:MAG: lytic transglycosylase domain-containing protein [Desulfobacteraceae bacterium]|nr:MAG: lytic transglycosylase domain-containing protein [Desulfobacteraceae bacterium]